MTVSRRSIRLTIAASDVFGDTDGLFNTLQHQVFTKIDIAAPEQAH